MDVLMVIWQLATVFLVLYYLFFYSLFLFKKRPKKQSHGFDEAISIIICARNEAQNLKHNLPLVLAQQYNTFEVLVVNDRSSDESAEVLKQLARNHKNLRVLELKGDEGYHGKKKALGQGIEAAQYDYVLLTDADCRPANRNWLKRMAFHLKDKEIVLGYGAYTKEKNWINYLVQWETLHTATQYFSMARAGLPYMGVGRNLAYKKYLFLNSNGFNDHLDLPSGDDDLFISSVANATNVALEYHRESFTYSKAPENFKQWWKQKRRHLSTSVRYPLPAKNILALYGIAQLIFYLLLVYALIKGNWIWVAVKFVVHYIFLWFLAKRFKTREIWFIFPFWELLQVFFTALILLQNQLEGHPKAWK